MTFSERAKPLKEKSKATLLEIATACNISESMASRYINGQNIPPEDIARKMLDFLIAATPTERKNDSVITEMQFLRSSYEERINDMRDNISDLKSQLHAEKREKWIFFLSLVVVVVFVFALLCVDITNGNVGWFRH